MYLWFYYEINGQKECMKASMLPIAVELLLHPMVKYQLRGVIVLVFSNFVLNFLFYYL